jgi:hypothetical protein
MLLLAAGACLVSFVFGGLAGGIIVGTIVWKVNRRTDPVPASNASASNLPASNVNDDVRKRELSEPGLYSREEFEKLVKGKTTDEVIQTIGRPDSTIDVPLLASKGGYMNPADIRGAAQQAAIAAADHPRMIFRYRSKVMNPFTGRSESVSIKFDQSLRVMSCSWGG